MTAGQWGWFVLFCLLLAVVAFAASFVIEAPL